jgi:hypothetical protein
MSNLEKESAQVHSINMLVKVKIVAHRKGPHIGNWLSVINLGGL